MVKFGLSSISQIFRKKSFVSAISKFLGNFYFLKLLRNIFLISVFCDL